MPFQFITKVFIVVEVSSVQVTRVLPRPALANHVSMELTLCTGHCHAGTGLGLVPVKA